MQTCLKGTVVQGKETWVIIMSVNAHAVIGPGVTVSIRIDHRGDVNVKVLQHLLQLLCGVV